MKTKTAAWLYGLLNLVIVFVMIFGLLGTTQLKAVQASPVVASPVLDAELADYNPAGMPSGDAQRHPYTLPESAARFDRPMPAADRALVTNYQPDRLSSILEETEPRSLPEFIPPATPAGISVDESYAFAVDPFYDVLWSWGFPEYEDITLTVGTDTYVRTSDEYGNVDWVDLGHDFVVGELITLTCGSLTKSHKVQKLTLTDLDQTLDIVKGTTKAGAEVIVGAVNEYDNWVEFSVTANTEGIFKAKMGVVGIDLVPGVAGNIGRWESDGDGTVINWTVGAPHIRVYPDPNHNRILGFEWWPAAQVDLAINDVFYASAFSDPWGFVRFDDMTEPLTPGVVVQMTDGKTTRTHTVTPMSFDLIDQVNDRVEGTGVPGLVRTYAGAPGVDIEWVDTMAISSGKWIAEYTTDIVPGSDGGARQFDTEGNLSSYYWYIPNPGFEVKPEEDTVWGFEWPPLTEIKLTVNGDEYYRTSNENGDVDFYDLERDIVTGDVVEMTAGTVTKTHIVHYLTVDEVNADLDRILGYTETGKHLETWACTNGECWGMEVESTMDTGYWAANYSELTDFVPGTDGGVRFWEDDNTATMVYWRVPDPWIAVNVNDNYVWCSQWGPNIPATLFIDGEEISTIDLDYWGNGGFYDIKTEDGQEVTVTGGGFTKSTIVQNLTLGGVDQFANTVFGTADPGSELEIWAWDETWGADGGAMYTTTDSSGNWLIDFSANWDIKPGWNGYAQIHELNDSDYTEVSWNIPMPWMRVYIALDEICAYQWTPGSVVTITVDDYSNTMTANEYGEFCSGYVGFDLVPGDYVEMTDGFTTKSHTTYDIVLSGYDLDLDTLYGTTEPFSWIHGAACNNGECNDSFYDESIGASGEWLLDFSGIVDIQPGTEGWIDKGDDDNDYTFIDWRIPRPRFNVNIVEDYVWCGGWASFAELTLNIDGIDVETATANFRGGVGFWGYDIQPGQTVKVRHGMYEKTHLVNNLEVTAVDPLSDTISGTADLGSVLDVRVNHSSGFENVYPVVQADRTWTADFSGIWDIVPGNDGYARLLDEDGDNTEVTWRVPDPFFAVNLNYDYIWGNEWEPNSTVTVNVRGTDVTTEPVSGDGIIGIGIADFNIQPGDTVTVRDANITKTLIVRDIALTRVDEISNTISGTAEAGIEIDVGYSGDDNYYNVYVITDSSGVWSADFDTIGIDLDLGDFGYAQIYDEIGEEDGDYTEVRWDVYAPVYPAYQEKLTTSKVTFDWDDVPDATAYKIQLSTKADFSTLVFSLKTTDSTYAYGTRLANNTTYYWRVRPLYADGKGAWLPVWKFTSMDPLAKPLLDYPAPKQIITDDDTPTLDWQPVENGVTYLVQISKLVDFSTLYFKATVSATEFQTNPLPDGKYFWRVKAIDASGGKGPWSEIRMFKIAVP